MRWYGLLSLLSDGRVKFLLLFIVVAIVVAGILTYVEIELKKRKERRLAIVIDDSVIGKMRIFLKKENTPRKKLDIINKTAKEYFREIYGVSINSNYSTLIKEFKKINRKNEVAFCEAMFSAYYSHEELTNNTIVTLGNLLINIEKKKKRDEDISKVPGFMEKIDMFFNRRRDVFLKKSRAHIKKRNFRKLKRMRVAERNKELKLIKKRKGVLAKRKKRLVSRMNRELISARREHRLKVEKENRAKMILESKFARERIRINKTALKKKRKKEKKAFKKRKKILKRQIRDTKRSEFIKRKKSIIAAKEKAKRIKIARIKILKYEANFKKQKTRRDKKARIIARKLEKINAKKIKNSRRSQI